MPRTYRPKDIRESRGFHELKGLPEKWELFALVTPDPTTRSVSTAPVIQL